MVTGSAAEGVSDFHSDLDMTVYYADELPDEQALSHIRGANGSARREWLIGSRAEGGIAEAYELGGIQVQIGHTTIAAWERDMADVLDRFNPDTPVQKALSGTLDCVAVAGHELIAGWKARIAEYPDGLRRAMIRRYLQFFPLWSLPHIVEKRDATIWCRQVLVQAAFNLIGVLAGLNRRYFSTFQFKKMQLFVASMSVRPSDCVARIESLFALPPMQAAHVLESLVTDVVALVEQDVAGLEEAAAVRRRLGYRRPAWPYPGR